MKKMIGIYKITNLINNQVYIGQSIHIEERIRQHKTEYMKKGSENSLYSAIRYYGLDNFKFEIIEACSPEALNEKEIYWINYYNSFENGYNLTPGGQARFFNHNDFYELWDAGYSVGEISEKLKVGHTTVQNYLKGYNNYNASESHKRGGKKINVKNNNKPYKNIYQYDFSGNLIKIWHSTKEIQRELKINGESISRNIKNERLSAGGYIWSDKPITFSPIGKRGQKAIECINNGLIFHSLKDAQFYAQLKSKTGILNSCKSYNSSKHSSAGKDKDGNKLYWRYIE